MPGLFEHLLDALPIHAAMHGARASTGLAYPPASSLIRFLKPLGVGEDVDHALPPVPPITKELGFKDLTTQVKETPLWGWKHSAGDLGGLSAVHCRVRETGYKAHVALEKLRWGFEEKAHVEVTHESGQVLKLPLEQKYLQSKWRTSGGWSPKGGHALHPLEAIQDSGLVLAFVYELDMAGGKVNGIQPFAPKGKYTPFNPEYDKLLKEMAGRASVGDVNAWLEALSGSFMALPGKQPETSATTGENKELSLSRPRIIVIVSFSTFRERADFEPGALVGMARIYPHVMVRSAVKLTKVASTVTLQRPSGTTMLDSGNGNVIGNCCGANTTIEPILVADSNDYTTLPQKPFWAGVFAYFVGPAQKDSTIAGKKIKIVDRNKGDRTKAIGKRHLVFNVDAPLAVFKSDWGVIKDMKKVPRQGEFDNLHLAPSLALKAVKARSTLAFGFGDGYPLTNAAMKLDPVYMAPFCSHDCFHTHWRWSLNEDNVFNNGWGEGGPYSKAGAPMVPLNQDVALEVQAANKVSYHAYATPLQGQTSLPLCEWQITMHHGSAYAQGIANWRDATMASINSFMARETIEFYDARDERVDSSARMYWYLRYYPAIVGGKVVAKERVELTPAEVTSARAL